LVVKKIIFTSPTLLYFFPIKIFFAIDFSYWTTNLASMIFEHPIKVILRHSSYKYFLLQSLLQSLSIRWNNFFADILYIFLKFFMFTELNCFLRSIYRIIHPYKQIFTSSTPYIFFIFHLSQSRLKLK
jgi:hypothetical protein